MMDDDWDAEGAEWGAFDTPANNTNNVATNDGTRCYRGGGGRGSGFTPRRELPDLGRKLPDISQLSTATDVGDGFDWTNGMSGWNTQESAGSPTGNQENLNGDCLTIYIPSHLTGKVIGKGGSTIKEVQSISGARVNVDRNATGSDTKIDVIGTAEQRKKAKDHIHRIAGIETQNGKSGENAKAPEPEDEPIDWGSAIAESERLTTLKWASLPPLAKDFYREDDLVTKMTQDEVDLFRENNNKITIQHFDSDDTRPLPKPCVTFENAFRLFPEIMHEIIKNKFVTPSPIQAQAWPVLLQGIDLIGIAQTGTGKTLAYLLPAMIHIEGQVVPRKDRPGPTSLILAPTRELAQQIEKEAQKYSYRGIRTICVYGGGDRRAQIAKINTGVEIVIATPGRLNDLCSDSCLNLTAVSYLVLDEADRMLDMGFEPQIRKVLLDIRPDRQTVMMSATWPSGVRRLATSYMKTPMQIYVNTLDLAACHSVTQRVDIIKQDEKREHLNRFFNSMSESDKVIVFVGKKLMADELSSNLAMSGVNAQCIHGDRDQSDREQALEDLKSGSVRILIATDVASRGLDIDDITHIVNYDFPRNIEEYVHRIGRTGRAGRSGISITFMCREDWRNSEELIKILTEANQVVPDELVRMKDRYNEFLERKRKEEEAFGIRGRGDRGGGRGGFGGGGGGFGGGGGGFGGGGGGFGGGGGEGARRSRW